MVTCLPCVPPALLTHGQQSVHNASRPCDIGYLAPQAGWLHLPKNPFHLHPYLLMLKRLLAQEENDLTNQPHPASPSAKFLW